MLPVISGYQIRKTLYQSSKSILYLAVRTSDGQQVVLKTLNDEYPNHQQIARFLHEFEIHKKLNNITGVAKVYGLETFAHQQALIMEYVSGGELEHNLLLIQDRQRFMALFFKAAIQIAQTLGEIHQQGVIHKDIKPRNILWHTESQSIKIIDFSIASELSREKQSDNVQLLAGSLPYLSPEQTGRMNRATDYRSDFYSLGISFYKLLTATLPFDVDSDDPLAWIHCHIAKEPKPLKLEDTNLLPALSAIIEKLMAKNAEDRYQSAFGLKNDLELCYTKWQKGEIINDFVAGQHDVFDRFEIPQKLYGREQEVALLEQTFGKVATGDCQMFLVSGFSGIGKSALINEIHRPIVAKHGYFISGKFDQFQRNIPYSALAQAFRGLMQQLLTESPERLQVWQQKLLTALSSNGQVLIDFIPELEQIIGKQPPVSHLGTEENQNRFNNLALKFVQLFAQKEHPLVLFIDDLQWVDSASLHLLKLFMLSQELHYFLLLGAYRDNEVDNYHSFMLLVDELKKAQVNVFDLSLNPLKLAAIHQLVSESLNVGFSQCQPLAELILGKTAGNPFFINQFLKHAVEMELLYFAVQQKSWQWDLAKINALESCDNVVDLMVIKMNRLPTVTQELISLAACIGNVFDLHNLAIISERTVQQVAEGLWPAVTAGLLMPLGDEHALLKVKSVLPQHNTEEEKRLNAVDRFLHDRVQQAAYSLIAENQKQQVHLKIARLLLENIPSSELANACFDIVEHYNKSLPLLQNDTERCQVAELNVMAGQKAKEATAYEPALRYFSNAALCLAQMQENSNDGLRFVLEKGQIESLFLLGRNEEGLKQAEQLLKQCHSVTEKVALNNVLILYYGGAGQMDKAIDIALDSLRLFEMEIPRNPSQLQLLLELARAKIKLGGKTEADLVRLPLIQDQRIHAIFSLLKELIAPTYLQGLTNLLPYIILRMFNLTLEHGNGPVASFAYSGYALLWAKLGDFAEAYRFGKIAMHYNKYVNNPPMEARCYFMATSFALYWREPLKNSQPPRKIGLQKLIDTGEYFWASYIYLFGFWQEVVLSKSVNEIIELTQREMQFAHKAKQIEPYYVDVLQHNLFKNWAGQTDDPETLDSQMGEEAQAAAYFSQNVTSTMGKFYHVVCRLLLHYYAGQYEKALAVATQPEMTEEVIRDGTFTRVIYTFYTCLSVLALASNKNKPASLYASYAKHKQKIKQWHQLCAENFAVLWYLLQAEEARVLEQESAAIHYYHQALQAAKKQKSLWFESLVNELTGKFWQSRDNQKMASAFMMEAGYLYYRWGASRKSAALEKAYPELFIRPTVRLEKNTDRTEVATQNTSSRHTESALDITTLFKASQTLSGEIVMDKLLQKLMHFLIENAGAQRGVLILTENNQFVIEAETRLEEGREILTLPGCNLDKAVNLSVMIVRYVARTKEMLLIDDVSADARFITDSYLQKAKVKSLLCLPLLDKGELSGILYLENNIASNAFAPDRVEILQILSAEMAISLENARLYRQLAQYNQTLEESVKERTADLWGANEALQKKNAEIQLATKIIEEKNNDITKSILYAQKIQAAMLPQAEKIAQFFPAHFILFKPKEIVSGDFYWFENYQNKLFLIVGDCTGHGVPGAFLSTIAQMLLNKIILEKRIFDPALILEALHEEVRMTLKQKGKTRQGNDGMDIGICQIDLQSQLLAFAGARRPLYLVKAGSSDLIKIAGTRKSVGGRQKEQMRRFGCHVMTFSDGDMLYLGSDGLADQQNEQNHKFGSTQLAITLQKIADKDSNTQQQLLTQALEQHQAQENQRDDITLVGVRLSHAAFYRDDIGEEKKMKLFDLLNFRQLLIENDIVLSFEGKMSQGVLVALVDTLKERLNVTTYDVAQQRIKKIYSIFIELAQNIQNHSSEQVIVDNQKIGAGIMVIQEDEKGFIVSSGNKISTVNAEKLQTYCDQINALDDESLKKLYKEKLRSVRPDNTSGAGIGLIEVIRKSGNPISYTQQVIDENNRFFTLSINLSKVTS